MTKHENEKITGVFAPHIVPLADTSPARQPMHTNHRADTISLKRIIDGLLASNEYRRAS